MGNVTESNDTLYTEWESSVKLPFAIDAYAPFHAQKKGPNGVRKLNARGITIIITYWAWPACVRCDLSRNMDCSEQLIGDEIQGTKTILKYYGLTDSQTLHHKLELFKEGMSIIAKWKLSYIRDNFRRLHGYSLYAR